MGVFLMFDLAHLNEELFDAVVRRQSVQAMISRAYGCIGLPIIAFDVSFKLLGYAFPRPFCFDKWEQIAAEGQLSADVIDEDQSLTYQELMYSSGKSGVFNWGTVRDYPQVDGPILLDGSLVGYVGIGIEGCPDVDALLEANDLLANTLAIALRDSAQAGGGREESRRAAESLLLSDRIAGDAALQFAAAYSPPYLFAVLASDDCRVSTLQYVRSLLCTDENFALGALSKDRNLHILFHHVGKELDLSCVSLLLGEVSAKYGFRGGISDFFSDAADLPGRRMQAMLAMAVGRGEKRDVSSFRDCYGAIVCRSALEGIGPSVCALDAVERPAEADRQEGAEYLPTLRAYLHSFQDRASAAQRLGIHKNTVLYRIHRIEELLGADLSDAAWADRLELGLALHDLSGGEKEARA